MSTLSSKVQLSARRLQFSEKASEPRIVIVACYNTNAAKIELGLQCLELHMGTCRLVHNWREPRQAACVCSLTAAQVRLGGSRFAPPIEIKPDAAIIFPQRPESLASSCKTVTKWKRNWKGAWRSVLQSRLRFHSAAAWQLSDGAAAHAAPHR